MITNYSEEKWFEFEQLMFEFIPKFILYFTEEEGINVSISFNSFLAGTFIWIPGVKQQRGYYIPDYNESLYLYFSLAENIFSFYGEDFYYNSRTVNIPYNERNVKYCYLGIS